MSHPFIHKYFTIYLQMILFKKSEQYHHTWKINSNSFISSNMQSVLKFLQSSQIFSFLQLN